MNKVIAHAVQTYLPLTETFIYNYLLHFKECTPIVITKKLSNLEAFPFPEIYIAPKERHWLGRYKWERLYLCLFRKALKKRNRYFEGILNERRARLIHAHFGPVGVSMLDLKKRLKLPLITTFYGYDLSQLLRQKEWRIAYQELFEAGELFLVEGSYMKESLVKAGCPSSKIKIQHMAVETQTFKFHERRLKDGDKIRILFCGRFTEKKGLMYGLKAVKMLSEKFSNIDFRIIGDGELKPEIKDFIGKEGMGAYVSLLGFQSYDVYIQEIQNAHILLQPSVTAKDGDSEGGAPTVLMEAQATGLPVVSTTHADIPEVVKDGEGGFLVAQRNAQALTDALAYLLNHPQLLAEMGKKGSEHIRQNYNINFEVKKLEDIYSQYA